MIIVAKDGSGDYTGIQEAIDAVPGGGRKPQIILLRMDTYNERVIVNKDNVRIIGEARDRTVISRPACAKDKESDGGERDPFLSFSVLVTGNNVEFENLTVQNDAGNGQDAGQAMAVYAAGDRGVWRNCRLTGGQAALFIGPLTPCVEADILPRKSCAECVEDCADCPATHSRQYFEDCVLRGGGDLIIGPYCAWFERCTLHMTARGGAYTAANTPEGQEYGLIFHQCRLTGECPAGEAYLGRPWGRYARALFLACEMDACVSPRGFCCRDGERPVTQLCGEWHTGGARSDQGSRHPEQKRLSDEEASAVTIPEVLSGFDGWRPDRRVPTWYMCGDSTMADYPKTAAPMTGWGQALPRLLPETVFVENCAVNGRSSKSFVAEKRLNYIELCLRPGDKVIISFSHNDEKADPMRSTSARATFPEYLNMYIDAARRQQAEPILVTPIPRQHFDADGRLLKTHGAYPDAIRDLAFIRGVRLIDLENAAMALFSDIGPKGCDDIFCHVPAGHVNYPEGCADRSHLQERGAIRIASLFLHLLGGEKAAVSASEQTSDDLTALFGEEDRLY